MHGNPPPVFMRKPWAIQAGVRLFCSLQKIASGLGGRTGFISRTISHWAIIRWEGEMFHYMYEVDLGFGHFRRD